VESHVLDTHHIYLLLVYLCYLLALSSRLYLHKYPPYQVEAEVVGFAMLHPPYRFIIITLANHK